MNPRMLAIKLSGFLNDAKVDTKEQAA